MCNWDGHWYQTIAVNGYNYSRSEHSSIVFFPLYPLTARALCSAGVPAEIALLLVSNGCFLGALLLFERYLCAAGAHLSTRRWALLALAFAPCSFFFHVAYTESMLLLLTIAALYGMRRRWPLASIAFCIGAATATRSVGVALLVPLAIHLNARLREEPADWDARLRLMSPRRRGGSFSNVTIGASWLALSCWGLLAFIAFQVWRFGDPLAFAHAQFAWGVRDPAPTLRAHIVQLVSLEPIWSTYIPHTAGYWGSGATNADPLLNLSFANPLFFLGTALLLGTGVALRLLDMKEVTLGALLLLIPYIAQTSRQCMTSQGRFATVVFPAYIVLGHLFVRLPRPVALYFLFSSGALMILYATLFGAGYEFL